MEERMPISPHSLLEHVSPDELPDDLRALHRSSLDAVGEAERIEVFGSHPDLYRWYVENFYGRIFADGAPGMVVERRWKELLRLKMSLTNGCFVCNRANIPTALTAGFSRAQVDAILAPTGEDFDEAELAVLELGDQFVMGNKDGQLTTDLYARLRHHFSDAEILELGLIATVLTAWTRMMFVFDLVTREDSCAVPG
jgi:alkylhydroperoxidase family enzyme